LISTTDRSTIIHGTDYLVLDWSAGAQIYIQPDHRKDIDTTAVMGSIGARMLFNSWMFCWCDDTEVFGALQSIILASN